MSASLQDHVCFRRMNPILPYQTGVTRRARQRNVL